jgi:hypothetical protein
MKEINDNYFISPELIFKLNSSLQQKKFDQVLELFKLIKESYNSVQLTAFIKILYYNYVGLNKDIASFLYENFQEYHLYSPYNSQCYSWNCEKKYIDVVFNQEGISTVTKPIKLITLEIGEYKIPKINHNVWVTSSDFSESKREEKFWVNNRELKGKVNVLQDFEHIMWTTDNDLIPLSVKVELKELSVQLRSLSDLYNEMKIDSGVEDLELLINATQISAELKLYAISSDILRYLVVQHYGGLYSDGDYSIYKNPSFLFSTLDGIFGNEVNSFKTISSFNGFFAAKPNHAVTSEVLKDIARNIIAADDMPIYIKYPCQQNFKSNLFAGVSAFNVAVQKAINHEDSNDAILPFPSIVHSYGINDARGINKIGILGNDGFSGSWKDFTKLDYSE